MSTYKPSQMAAAINTIGRAVLEEKTTSTVTSNGNVIVTPTNGYDGMSKVIVPVEVSGGSSEVPESDVNFYDYDGTVVYSYTSQEFAQLTAMPTNPDRTAEGLTAQGWNWSLADAKAYVADYGMLDIGQMYTTVSGATEIDIDLNDPDFLHPYIVFRLNGTATMDWGDGSAAETVTGSSLSSDIFKDHIYAQTGTRMFKLRVTTGSVKLGGVSGRVLLCASETITNDSVYASKILRVRLGDNVTLGHSAFVNCFNLESISLPSSAVIESTIANNCLCLKHLTLPIGTQRLYGSFNGCISLQSVSIPNDITRIDTNAFQMCVSIKHLAFPENVADIPTNMLGYCVNLCRLVLPKLATTLGQQSLQNLKSLLSITLPSGLTTIGQYAMQSCTSLRELTIPASVTSIGASAFATNVSLAIYHIKPTAPPTLGNNAFQSILPNAIIYVPSASVDAYKAAGGWSDYASYIQGE